MHRISIPWMLDVIAGVDGLNSVSEGLVTEHLWTLFNAKSQLEALFSQSVYVPHLRISRQHANTLITKIASLLPKQGEDAKEITPYDKWNLHQQLGQFRTVFVSELSTLPSFLVREKEGYDIGLLLDEGFRLFPASLGAKVPEAVFDAMEAGKALGYELATACGFHTFRVVEAVLKRYWDHVSSKAARPSLETIGNYAAELERRSLGDLKTIESLKQLAKLHRNPLIHPEVILTVEEAIDTLGIARSVVGMMLRSMPETPPTTSLPASSPPLSS